MNAPVFLTIESGFALLYAGCGLQLGGIAGLLIGAGLGLLVGLGVAKMVGRYL